MNRYNVRYFKKNGENARRLENNLYAYFFIHEKECTVELTLDETNQVTIEVYDCYSQPIDVQKNLPIQDSYESMGVILGFAPMAH